MKTDGGPAFPTWDGPELVVQGMSLRDYFAAHVSEEEIKIFIPKTMGGVLEWGDKQGISKSLDYVDVFSLMCAWARYKIADAMIKARELKDETDS